jgi:ABC-type amino acid transport substrate-binding protein
MGIPRTPHESRRFGTAAWLRRGATAAAMAAICLIASFAGARAEDRLRIITSGNYPPFVFSDASGALGGFEIDFANALCAVLAVRCQFIDLPFEETIPALVAGRGDAIVASLSITAQRRKVVAFTDRYYRTAIQFVASSGFARPVTAEGLKSLRVAVTRGTTAEATLRSRFVGAEIVGFVTQSEANQALVDGRVELILADSFAMWRFLKSDPGRGFAAVGGPLYVDEGIGVAVRKDEDTLRQKLNLAIARLRLDGTFQRINAKYFPFSIY